MELSKKTTILFSPEFHRRLSRLAARRGVSLGDSHPLIMARDALHAAVVMAEGLEAICSYDPDFDRIKGIVRREPDA